MKKFLLDVTLLALFVAELSFHHLPKILHEILGVALAAAIVLHVAINFRRLSALLKKFSTRKIFGLAVDFGLAVAAPVILFAGVCMSNYLFADFVSFELRRNMTIHQLHVALPYVMMILIGVHVGLHWRELWHRFLSLTGATEFFQRQQKLFIAATIILAVTGVYGLYLNRVVDRIMMKHIFATPATELPLAIFALLIVGGVTFFTLITFLFNRK